MKIEIEKSFPSGTFIAPPSKSYGHRLLICSALCDRSTTVYNVAKSDDMYATLNCIRALGKDYLFKGRHVTVLDGVGTEQTGVFDCNESGSTLRFFIPIALSRGGVFEFKGTKRLISRGISVYEQICERQNISVKYTDNSIIFSGKLRPDIFEIRGDISSQFISGLFFALPTLDGDSTVKIITAVESRPYIDITLDCLSKFGIEICEKSENEFFIRGNQKYNSISTRVEGDFSNSAFLDAFGILGADVSVKGLDFYSRQGDKVYVELFKKINDGYLEADISSCPDLGPILFALCSAKNGGYITGTKRLKIKESDRAEAMAKELSKFGIRVSVYENAVEIHKGALKKPVETLSSHNDHRIAMSLTALASLTGATIDGAEAVSKSFPGFFKLLKTHGMRLKQVK